MMTTRVLLVIGRRATRSVSTTARRSSRPSRPRARQPGHDPEGQLQRTTTEPGRAADRRPRGSSVWANEIVSPGGISSVKKTDDGASMRDAGRHAAARRRRALAVVGNADDDVQSAVGARRRAGDRRRERADARGRDAEQDPSSRKPPQNADDDRAVNLGRARRLDLARVVGSHSDTPGGVGRPHLNAGVVRSGRAAQQSAASPELVGLRIGPNMAVSSLARNAISGRDCRVSAHAC